MKYAVQRHSFGFWHPIHALEDAFTSWDQADRYIEYLTAWEIPGPYRIQEIEPEATEASS